MHMKGWILFTAQALRLAYTWSSSNTLGYTCKTLGYTWIHLAYTWHTLGKLAGIHLDSRHVTTPYIRYILAMHLQRTSSKNTLVIDLDSGRGHVKALARHLDTLGYTWHTLGIHLGKHTTDGILFKIN